MKTDDKTLIEALRILSRDIQSDDGVANACIAEAANRLAELTRDDMVLVPREPTDRVLGDMAKAFYGSSQDTFAGRMPEIYKAMIKACEEVK